MRVLIQRVKEASVTVEDEVISSIGKGLLVFLGIASTDDFSDIDYVVNKTLALRFPLFAAVADLGAKNASVGCTRTQSNSHGMTLWLAAQCTKPIKPGFRLLRGFDKAAASSGFSTRLQTLKTFDTADPSGLSTRLQTLRTFDRATDSQDFRQGCRLIRTFDRAADLSGLSTGPQTIRTFDKAADSVVDGTTSRPLIVGRSLGQRVSVSLDVAPLQVLSRCEMHFSVCTSHVGSGQVCMKPAELNRSLNFCSSPSLAKCCL
ncbi:MAG: D-aminoacyl-tRNA deacylase [Microbacteriaceae bacterium]|nr:D-aminoacyl-tRNA deacylase [Microbacteriaceae bacterium]